METLIDMNPVPSRHEYALWAYEDSGVEELWPDKSDFLSHYNRARDILNQQHADLHEDSFLDRFIIMCKSNSQISTQNKTPESIAEKLAQNFLNTYYSRCFVHDDVNKILPKLAGKYNLGIVSNFKTKGGIETMLKTHGLAAYFNFILVSISFGRRKPHKSIYQEAIRKSQVNTEYILFIGDDITNDIQVPKSLGMQTLFLDRYNKHNQEYKKINTFYELESLL